LAERRLPSTAVGGGSFMWHLRWDLAMAARVGWRSHEQGARPRPTRRRAPLRSSAAAHVAPNARVQRGRERHL